MKLKSLFTLMSGVTSLMLGMPVYAQEVLHGPPPSTVGCFRLGDEQIKFVYRKVENNDPTFLKGLADSISTDCDESVFFNNKWFWEGLPGYRNKYLFLMWKNLSDGNSAWTVVENKNSTWNWLNNKGETGTLRQGELLKQTWWPNGYRIELNLFKPSTESGWSDHDIWYSLDY
jgi:hypothetical protein